MEFGAVRGVDEVADPTSFRFIHGDVRALEHCDRVVGVARAQRDPDARSHIEGRPLNHDRLPNRCEDRLGYPGRAGAIGPRQEDAKLVAADPGGRSGIANDVTGPRGQCLETIRQAASPSGATRTWCPIFSSIRRRNRASGGWSSAIRIFMALPENT